jgi:hypothetical protein
MVVVMMLLMMMGTMMLISRLCTGEVCWLLARAATRRRLSGARP